MCFEFEFLYWAQLEEEMRLRKPQEEQPRVSAPAPQAGESIPAKPVEQEAPVPV